MSALDSEVIDNAIERLTLKFQDMHEENWIPLIRSLGTFTAIAYAVGGGRPLAVD
jgi:hypothetical protein